MRRATGDVRAAQYCVRPGMVSQALRRVEGPDKVGVSPASEDGKTSSFRKAVFFIFFQNTDDRRSLKIQ